MTVEIVQLYNEYFGVSFSLLVIANVSIGVGLIFFDKEQHHSIFNIGLFLFLVFLISMFLLNAPEEWNLRLREKNNF